MSLRARSSFIIAVAGVVYVKVDIKMNLNVDLLLLIDLDILTSSVHDIRQKFSVQYEHCAVAYCN